jgi:DNA-directed RNA polymerase specialized sigma24 family protein
MGNMWDAADLVQETLVRGFSHLGRAQETGMNLVLPARHMVSGE